MGEGGGRRLRSPVGKKTSGNGSLVSPAIIQAVRDLPIPVFLSVGFFKLPFLVIAAMDRPLVHIGSVTGVGLA